MPLIKTVSSIVLTHIKIIRLRTLPPNDEGDWMDAMKAQIIAVKQDQRQWRCKSSLNPTLKPSLFTHTTIKNINAYIY